MGGFLDASYGAAEEKRSRTVKKVILWGGTAIVLGVVLFFWFRNYRQEQIVQEFLSLLQQKKYPEAYAMWGCTQDHPCKYYSTEKFLEDWGGSSPWANPSAIKIVHEDNCGNGVVFSLETPKADPTGLFVDKDTNTLSFAPEARCPGRHLQIWEFIKSRFS